MATKIRLSRRGRKRLPIYDIVVADSRSPRDGKFIEKIGLYNPNVQPVSLDLDVEKATDWVLKGASPTDTARRLLSSKGVMLKKHLQIGVNKGSISQEEADKKFAAWIEEKAKTDTALADKLQQEKDAVAKTKKEAEMKVAADREKAQQEALDAAKAELAALEAEEAGEAAPEAATEEAPAAEAAAEETPAAEAKEEAPAKEEASEEEKKAE